MGRGNSTQHSDTTHYTGTIKTETGKATCGACSAPRMRRDAAFIGKAALSCYPELIPGCYKQLRADVFLVTIFPVRAKRAPGPAEIMTDDLVSTQGNTSSTALRRTHKHVLSLEEED